jgi:PAS domain S-box-containing protein
MVDAVGDVGGGVSDRIFLPVREREHVPTEDIRYRELFDFAPAAYLITDPDAVILQANTAAEILLGVPATALAGKPLELFVAAADRRRFRHRLLNADDLDLREWELRVLTGRGPALRAAATMSVARDLDGRTGELRWLLRELPAAMVMEPRGARAELALQRNVLPRALPYPPGRSWRRATCPATGS